MSAELRIDPLTGLKIYTPTGDHPPERDAQPDLFCATETAAVEEELPGLGATGTDLHGTVDAWRERMRAHAADAAYVHLAAGRDTARLFALDFVPAAVARERERFGAYQVRTMGGNLLADYVQEEVRRRSRIVAIDGEAVALCPYASRVARQVLIAPRAPRPRFEDDGPSGAALLQDVLRRLGGEPLLWVRTAPRGADAFCWRIDVLPRPPEPGELELGTGVAVCAVAPEQSAGELREA
jgi:UDPglucose--hexose-1-phosphate uridylyltransferase